MTEDNASNLPPEDDSEETTAAPVAPEAAVAPVAKAKGKAPAPKAAAPAMDQAAFDAAVAAGVAAALAAQAAAANVPEVEKLPASTQRVTIVVEENDNIPPTGIFIGANGRSYLIRPGENVDVPLEVIEGLNDAVESTPKTDQQGNVVDYRNRLRFPYRIVSK